MSETEAIFSLIKNITWSDKFTRDAVYYLILAIEDKLKLYYCRNAAAIVKSWDYIRSDKEPSSARLLLKCGNKYYTVSVEINREVHVKVSSVEEEK